MKKKSAIIIPVLSVLFFIYLLAAALPPVRPQKEETKNKITGIEDIALVPGIKANATEEKKPVYIEKTINELIGPVLKKWCVEAKVPYPPSFILFRSFKAEREFEIWGGDDPGTLSLIQTLPICSFDDQPGPKLITGDGKTPEGFYTCDISYGSRYWWMWIRLTSDNIDETGITNTGSSFKLCTNYPNAGDQVRTRFFAKGKSPGAEICIHGNCVSAGCISFKNRVFLPVYYFAYHHDSKKFGPIQVHTFPFRFSEKNKEKYASTYALMDAKSLITFWNNLEEGYNLFEKNHKPLKYHFNKDKYVFIK